METINIKSKFFDKFTWYETYAKTLSYIKTKEQLNEKLNFVEKNNLEFFNNIHKYKNFLVYGDVQSGKTDNLIYLTQKMCSDYKYNFVLFLAGTKNDLMFQNQERFYNAFKKMDKEKFIVINSQGKTKTKIDLFSNAIKENKTVIMHSIKRPKSLEKLFESLKMFKNELKILLIDDEGDEASLSKRTSSSIDNFFYFKNTKKISMTASPFLNLYKYTSKYDYFYKLTPSKTYTGINEFKTENYLLLKALDNENAILRPLIEWIIKTKENNLEKSQLLYNVFNKKNGHFEIEKYISKALMNLTSESKTKQLLEHLEINFDHKVLADFANKLLKNSIIVSNSDTIDSIEKNNFQIIIGGLKLSRGLTFENLISEVMINMGEKINAATLIQRARWFGHRGKMLPLIKIYVTKDVYEAFEEVKDLIRWTKIYHLSNNDFAFQFNSREYERIIL